MARPRAIARPRRQCASCLAGCDLARLRSGLLRCGTVGWPHRSRPGPQAGCDPDRPWHGAACVAGARHSCNCRARAGPGLQGGDTVRVAGHDVNGHEPGLQGQVAAVHDRACGDRSLLPAGRTFPARPATPVPSPWHGRRRGRRSRRASAWLRDAGRRRLHRESAPRRRRGTSGGRISSGWA